MCETVPGFGCDQKKKNRLEDELGGGEKLLSNL